MSLIDAIKIAETARTATDTELEEALLALSTLVVLAGRTPPFYARRIKAEQTLRRESVNEILRDKLSYD